MVDGGPQLDSLDEALMGASGGGGIFVRRPNLLAAGRALVGRFISTPSLSYNSDTDCWHWLDVTGATVLGFLVSFQGQSPRAKHSVHSHRGSTQQFLVLVDFSMS